MDQGILIIRYNLLHQCTYVGTTCLLSVVTDPKSCSNCCVKGHAYSVCVVFLRSSWSRFSAINLLSSFELPYNIWCNGCGSHVGMGVRYNAEKTKVGNYYSTPIYKFRMKCHLCDSHFEIQTDPKVHKNLRVIYIVSGVLSVYR